VQPTRSVAIKQLNNETSDVAPVSTGATHAQRRHQTAQ